MVTPEAFEDLQEAIKRAEIATIGQRLTSFCVRARGIEYSHPDGVGQLLRRRKVKLKTEEGLDMRKPTPKSKRLSKKLRLHREAQRAARVTAE